MSKVNQLKNKARREEQRENWSRAIEFYTKALDASRAAGEGFADLSLYNRIGDIYLRIGQKNTAVRYYEQAIEQYSDQDLHTSAIALCNKVLRILPERSTVYLQLGRLHLATNLIADARDYFHRYAQAMRERGGPVAGYEALEELIAGTGDPPTLSLWMSWLSDESDQDVVGQRVEAAREALEDHGIDPAEVLERVRTGDASAFEIGSATFTREDPLAGAFLSMPDDYRSSEAAGGQTESESDAEDRLEAESAAADTAELEGLDDPAAGPDLDLDEPGLGSVQWSDESDEAPVPAQAPVDLDVVAAPEVERAEADSVVEWTVDGSPAVTEDIESDSDDVDGLEIQGPVAPERLERPGVAAGDDPGGPTVEAIEDDLEAPAGWEAMAESDGPGQDAFEDASEVAFGGGPADATWEPELEGAESELQIEASPETGGGSGRLAPEAPERQTRAQPSLASAGDSARLIEGSESDSGTAPTADPGLELEDAEPVERRPEPSLRPAAAWLDTVEAQESPDELRDPSESFPLEGLEVAPPARPMEHDAVYVDLEIESPVVGPTFPADRDRERAEPAELSVSERSGVGGHPRRTDPSEAPVTAVAGPPRDPHVEVSEEGADLDLDPAPIPVAPGHDGAEPVMDPEGNWIAEAYDGIEKVMSAGAAAAAAKREAALATGSADGEEVQESGASASGPEEAEPLATEEASDLAEDIADAPASPPAAEETQPGATEPEEEEAPSVDVLEAETIAIEVPHQPVAADGADPRHPTSSDRDAGRPPGAAEGEPLSPAAASESARELESSQPLAEPRLAIVDEDPEDAFSDWVESASTGVLRRALPELEQRNEREKALLVIARLSRVETGEVVCRRKHVDLLEQLGRTEEAVEAGITLATALESMDRPIEARDAYRRVMALSPGDARAQEGLERLEGVAEDRPSGPSEPDEPRGLKPYLPSHVSTSEATMIATHNRPRNGATHGGPTNGSVTGGPLGGMEEAPRPYSGVAGGAEASSDFEALLSEFRAELSEKPATSDSMTRTEFGASLKEMGRLDDAIRELQAAVREPSPPPLAYELLGEAFLEKGQSRIAMRLLEKALATLGETDRELLGVLYQLGVTYERLDDPTNALQCYERIFSVDIDYRDVQTRILTCTS